MTRSSASLLFHVAGLVALALAAAGANAQSSHEKPAKQPAKQPAKRKAPSAPRPAATAVAAAAAARTDSAAARAAATAPAAEQGRDSLAVSNEEYQGWKTFHVYCYRCHGVDALGSDLAPNLRHSLGPEGSVTHDVFVTTVKEGRLAKGMPTWKELLDDQKIEQLYAYIKARSEKRLAPGRPHVAKTTGN